MDRLLHSRGLVTQLHSPSLLLRLATDYPKIFQRLYFHKFAPNSLESRNNLYKCMDESAMDCGLQDRVTACSIQSAGGFYRNEALVPLPYIWSVIVKAKSCKPGDVTGSVSMSPYFIKH